MLKKRTIGLLLATSAAVVSLGTVAGFAIAMKTQNNQPIKLISDLQQNKTTNTANLPHLEPNKKYTSEEIAALANQIVKLTNNNNRVDFTNIKAKQYTSTSPKRNNQNNQSNQNNQNNQNASGKNKLQQKIDPLKSINQQNQNQTNNQNQTSTPNQTKNEDLTNLTAYRYKTPSNKTVFVLSDLITKRKLAQEQRRKIENVFVLTNLNQFNNVKFAINYPQALKVIYEELKNVDFNKYSVLVVNGIINEYDKETKPPLNYGWQLADVNIQDKKADDDQEDTLSNQQQNSIINAKFYNNTREEFDGFDLLDKLLNPFKKRQKKYLSKMFFVVIDKLDSSKKYTFSIDDL